MENVKEGSGGAKSNNENPIPAAAAATESDSPSNLPVPQPSSRTPFTNLSQVDADLALARTLQEQERAYMMLRMNGEGSSDFGSSGDDFDDSEDHDHDQDDQDAFDVHDNLEQLEYNNHFDPSLFTSDEALARALQDGEERDLADRMMALTGAGNAWDAEDTDDNDSNSQDTWEEVDPDELSYEELLALGEVVGTESRGLSADTIASLPSVNYKAQSNQDGNTEQCVICRLEYEDEETLTVLSCKHIYHSECINNWLQINKVCPICSVEVSTSENR